MHHTERDLIIEALTQIITDNWAVQKDDAAQFYAGEHGDEAAARFLIQTFVEYCQDGKIIPDGSQDALACLHAMSKMLGRVLQVDMTASHNRRGDLPQVMGLVSRRKANSRLREVVIHDAFDHVKRSMGLPDRNDQECADLVAAAFEKSELLTPEEMAGLSVDFIKKTYYRIRDE